MVRKVIAVIAAVLCGLIILADFIFQFAWLKIAAARLLEGGLILVCFALLLGILKLLAYHLQRVRESAVDSWQSWVVVVILLGCLVICLALPASGPSAWIYDYMITPLMATLGALLIFYGVVTAPRLLSLRSWSAVLLFASCLIFMFLWIPYVSGLSPWIAAIRSWLFVVPLGAGMRGILLGIAIGASVTALRLIFAADRPYTTSAEKR